MSDINPTWNNQILYKAMSNGELGTWRIVVSEVPEGAVYKSYAAKVIGGKEKETLTEITEGKQKRTPYEQALSEAESKFKTKLRKGYSIEKPEIGAKPKNTLGFNIAVKAQKFHEVEHKPPYLISPKLDGHHMSAGVRDGQVVLYSMNSKELDIEHIRAELQRLHELGAWGGAELDGELYRHGVELDDIKSSIKKAHPDHNLLQFHVYDVMDHNETYITRYSRMAEFFKEANDFIIMEVGFHCTTQLNFIDEQHAKWLLQGYEGSMIRWGEAGYADSARSKYLLKKKDYQDAEFKVIGWELGKPKHKDGKQYERPILICMGTKGEPFKVGLHGSMVETHQAYLEDLDTRIGQDYTVKFFKMNVTGKPSQPIGLRFRSDV